MAIADLLDRYAELDKPITVTAAGVPSQVLVAAAANPPPENGAPPVAEPAPADGGFWRTPWSPETQALWVRQAVAVMLSKAYVQGVCWQDLYDSPGADMPAGGLLSDLGVPKPAATALAELRKSIQAPRAQPAGARPAA